MTVKELMAALAGQPENAVVLLEIPMESPFDIGRVAAGGQATDEPWVALIALH